MIRTLSATLATLAFLSIPLSAGAKINLMSRMSVPRHTASRSTGTEPECVIVTLAEGYTADDLAAAGFMPVACRAGIALVKITDNDIDSLARTAQVRSIRTPRLRVQPTMDRARYYSGLDCVHQGTNVAGGRRYRGAGVLAGMMDQGFDPNHVNFRNADGSSRFTDIWTFDGKDGEFTEYTGKEIDAFTTEMPESYHGTYTCGIMAGSYEGKGRLATPSGDGTSAVADNAAIPFVGAAPEAEIVAGCGKLYDANIIQAVENIVQYGKATGRRPVINLSLGSPGGPFDLSDPLCAYLNDAGREDAIIIAAAGNDGHKRMSLTIPYQEQSTVLSFIEGLPAEFDDNRANYIYIWGSDERFPDVEIVVADMASGEITTVLTPGEENEIRGICSYEADGLTDTVYNELFARHFTGDVSIGREVNQINGRSHTLIRISAARLHDEGKTALLGLRVGNRSGQRVDITNDASIQFSAFDIAGATNGNPDLSISSMVCGENIISVGAYVTRSESGCLDGTSSAIFNYFYPAEPGYPAYFSSYAIMPDGTSYPTVSAPGNEVVSSYSRYYTAGLPQASLDKFVASVTDSDGSLHYWDSECGTSAATPVVAGAVATWLEADPTLTTADVLDIIRKTAVTDDYIRYTDKPVRFGCGKFDALAGLNEVLSRSAATDGILADSDRFILTCEDRVYRAVTYGSLRSEVTVYDLAGRAVKTSTSDSESVEADLSALNAGVYIIRCSASYPDTVTVNNTKIILR